MVYCTVAAYSDTTVITTARMQQARSYVQVTGQRHAQLSQPATPPR